MKVLFDDNSFHTKRCGFMRSFDFASSRDVKSEQVKGLCFVLIRKFRMRSRMIVTREMYRIV